VIYRIPVMGGGLFFRGYKTRCFVAQGVVVYFIGHCREEHDDCPGLGPHSAGRKGFVNERTKVGRLVTWYKGSQVVQAEGITFV
jgi:hypothetical protein